MCGNVPLSEKDLKDYRTNYSMKWLDNSDGHSIHAFPCHGAVLAINRLCDEIEYLQKRLSTDKKEVGHESENTPPSL